MFYICNMDLNIAHAHLSHLRVIFTLAFAIQNLDYKDVLQTPVLTFAPTNSANKFMIDKKKEH